MSDLDELPDDDSGLDLALDAGRGRVRKSPTAFRTISEVADELHIPQHVLRFWETKFPQVKPLKRGGGRRYYRPGDLALLKRISDLLYIQGYTIKGVQRLLREGPPGNGAEAPPEESADDALEGEIGPAESAAEVLESPEHDDTERGTAPETAEAVIPSEPREDEVARLRAALRDAVAALEAIRATLG